MNILEQLSPDYRVKLIEALEVLRAIDPYLDADDVERSSLARHFIRRILRKYADWTIPPKQDSNRHA